MYGREFKGLPKLLCSIHDDKKYRYNTICFLAPTTNVEIRGTSQRNKQTAGCCDLKNSFKKRVQFCNSVARPNITGLNTGGNSHCYMGVDIEIIS